ncbi:MFS transporter [Rhodococcus sp. NPDC003348]
MHVIDTEAGPRGWRDLLGPAHLGSMVVLAGGVALYATNIYLTASLLPSAVEDIGGDRFFAWATTIFLVASVASAVLVSRLLALVGPRAAYLVAIAAFTAGTVVCALAPEMWVLLAGRALQGAGGGLISGLGYALIRSVLPSGLWTRASALVSAMWGVGTFVGPTVGGAFAQFGSWRLAFVALAVLGVGIAALVPRYIVGGRPESTGETVPVVSMVLLSAAALVMSVAGVAGSGTGTAVGVAAALVLLAVFVGYERARGGSVLPSVTFARGGTLKWTYLTIGFLAVASTAETFVPLFGQRLGGLAPLMAGFLGAALAIGWTLGEVASAGAHRARTVRAIVVAGGAAVIAGFAALAMCQRSDAPGSVIWLWAVALAVVGAGIGAAWPHLAAFAMASSEDPVQGARAASAINTVQLVSNAVGSAIAGVLVNLGTSTTGSARLLYGVFAAIAVLGVLTAMRATRPRARPGR